MGDAGEFNLIIEKVTSPEGATFLSEAFGLDPGLTQAMLKTTPIIFATKLTKAEVKALTPRLQELSKRGFEFRITARTAKLPKVNWLVRPNFALPSTGNAGAITFDFQNTAFVCPTCGDTFVFARVGQIPLTEGTPPAPPSTPAAAPPASKTATSSQPAAVVQPKQNKPTEPLKLELDENKGANPNSFADADLVEPLTDEALESGDVSKRDVPEIDLSSIEGPPQADGAAAKTSVNLSAALDESLAEMEPGTATATPAPGTGDDLYNVFVPEVKDKTRLEEVVKLVAQVRGISEDEARKLTKRVMIPVAKGVPKDEAEKILMQFKKIKTTGRMTRVTPGTPPAP
jgi:ribosomal protein L7/L12